MTTPKLVASGAMTLNVVNLGYAQRDVAVAPQQTADTRVRGERGVEHPIAARRVVVAQHAELLGIQAAHERGARRAADGKLAVGAGELHALRREAVEVRRADGGVAVAAETRGEIVANDQEDVGTSGRRCS